MNLWKRFLRFLPALIITFIIELFNSINLGNNADILQAHFAILIFEPVLSAIAGNIGLQTSSSINSFINVSRRIPKKRDKKEHEVRDIIIEDSNDVDVIMSIQQKKKKKKDGVKLKFLLRKYMSHNFVNILLLSIVMGITAYLWPIDPNDYLAHACQFPHALIIFIGALTNMLIASVAGLLTPYFLNRCGYDPASGAGPFETALQDSVGSIVFVLQAKIILSNWIPMSNAIHSSLALNCTL